MMRMSPISYDLTIVWLRPHSEDIVVTKMIAPVQGWHNASNDRECFSIHIMNALDNLLNHTLSFKVVMIFLHHLANKWVDMIKIVCLDKWPLAMWWFCGYLLLLRGEVFVSPLNWESGMKD